jgi:hypothetical protein
MLAWNTSIILARLFRGNAYSALPAGNRGQKGLLEHFVTTPSHQTLKSSPTTSIHPHFRVSRSNDIHLIIVIDSNDNSCYIFLCRPCSQLFPSIVPIASHHTTLRPIISPATPLELAVPIPPVSAHSKAHTSTRFSLESAFTRKPGGRGHYG